MKQTTNDQNKKKTIFWLCQCDCGNTSIVPSTDLVRGKTTQCWNCAHLDTGNQKRKTLVGQKFGKLIVIEMIYGNKSESGKMITKCKCQCNCGNIVIRNRDNLFSSKTPSCGCAKKEVMQNAVGTNVDGMKFGRLTVIKTLWNESPVKLKCVCDCGNEYIGVKSQITYGQTQSCGCLQKDMASMSNEKDWMNHISDYGIRFLFKHSKNAQGQWLWNCECPLCKNIFVALPAKVNNGHITSCGCRKLSSNEEFIFNLLKDICVNFVPQYSFKDCLYKNVLKFDFAVLDINNNIKFLIEFDGKQHFESIEFFGGKNQFKQTKIRDKIKNDYCNSKKIKLLRLPYFLTTKEIKQQILKILNDCGMPIAI